MVELTPIKFPTIEAIVNDQDISVAIYHNIRKAATRTSIRPVLTLVVRREHMPRPDVPTVVAALHVPKCRPSPAGWFQRFRMN